jgi:hypothetical protein
MSDNAIIVVEISITEREVPGRAAAVSQWLLETGIVEVNPKRDALWQPSQYRAGPRAMEVAPDFDRVRDLVNNGVDVISERQVHHPGGNYEPPVCPSCGIPMDQAAHLDLINSWWVDADEPLATCATCEASALLGDWPGEWTLYIGELAVCFNNWPPLADAFLHELGDRLGPRWRVIYQHI